jgi:hypothetical protein
MILDYPRLLVLCSVVVIIVKFPLIKVFQLFRTTSSREATSSFGRVL